MTPISTRQQERDKEKQQRGKEREHDRGKIEKDKEQEKGKDKKKPHEELIDSKQGIAKVITKHEENGQYGGNLYLLFSFPYVVEEK